MPRRFGTDDRPPQEASEHSGQDVKRTSLDALQRRVRAGGYDTVAVLDEVARRILESGDLACDSGTPGPRRLR
jgi:hypothetical protein